MLRIGRAPALTVLTVIMACACASRSTGGPQNSTLPPVELTARNDWHDVVEFCAQWDTRDTVCLGKLEPGDTVTFEVPVRGTMVRFTRGRWSWLSPSRVPAEYYEVRPGDLFVAVITSTGRTYSARRSLD